MEKVRCIVFMTNAQFDSFHRTLTSIESVTAILEQLHADILLKFQVGLLRIFYAQVANYILNVRPSTSERQSLISHLALVSNTKQSAI